ALVIGQHGFPALKLVGGIQEGDSGAAGTQAAVAVELDVLPGASQTHAAQGGHHFVDGAIRLKKQAVDAHRPVFVEGGRQVVVMVKQVPLLIKLDERVVVCPAARRRLVHNHPAHRERT
nr:hypothetical protein [Tanacetum cinerariifolium]